MGAELRVAATAAREGRMEERKESVRVDVEGRDASVSCPFHSILINQLYLRLLLQ